LEAGLAGNRGRFVDEQPPTAGTMASSTLQSRRNEAQLHALAGVERHIRSQDRSSRRKYLREFSRAFRSYQSVITQADLQSCVSNADLVLIGDYHALPAAQRFASSLFEQRGQAGDRRVILGIETVFSRDQHILDEWWRREIDEKELRQRIRFDLDWGYDWAPFYELLVTAREHGEAVYGLDCLPREDLRRIGTRDRHAAHKIAEIRERHPGAAILVLFGESHLAPQHLPRLLHETMPGDRVLTILQNVDPLYWQATAERQQGVEAVRLNQNTMCVFNATPLEKYENYRLHLSRWGRDEQEGPDLAPTIYNLIGSLIRFLGLKSYSSRNGAQPKFLVDLLPEIYTTATKASLDRLLAAPRVTPEEMAELPGNLEERGSIYFPGLNAFYVQHFKMTYAAEEVARFLHHACRGLPTRNGKQAQGSDRFHARAIEHALAYFGSVVLCPGRKPACDYNEIRFFQDREEFVRTRDRDFESSSQLIGYMLGARLYDSFLAGRAGRSFLRRLFLTPLHEPKKARETFRELTRSPLATGKPRVGTVT
jgi:Haem-binding uptake, Tiki superfamily, ChaN